MQKEVVVGATSIAQDTGIFPRGLNQLAGTKFKIVTGYASSGNVDIAMERGEVQGKIGATWTSLNSGPTAHWIPDKLITVLVQFGLQVSPDVPAGVPLALDLARTPEDRQALEVLYSPGAAGYPSFMGPGVPMVRVDAIRAAYAATLKDPDFIELLTKQRLDLDPIGWQEIEQAVHHLYNLPPAAIERARDLLPAL
jgi:hypothetical protein